MIMPWYIISTDDYILIIFYVTKNKLFLSYV